MLSKDVVAKALPPNLKGSVTDQMVAKLNSISTDPLVAETIRDNFISYTGVLKEGKFTTENYMNAVAFVSYKLMGHTNQDAYFKTFPQRYTDMVTAGKSQKDISSFVSIYAKGKLVNLIMEQSLVPTWVLNADVFQKAINTQAQLMTDVNVNPRDRVAAANSILTHLAKPKEAGPLLNIDMRENSGVNELRGLLEQLAGKQVEQIENGASIREIAGSKIIEGEVENGTD